MLNSLFKSSHFQLESIYTKRTHKVCFPLFIVYFFYVVLYHRYFLAKSAHCVLYSPSPRFKFDERNEKSREGLVCL